MKIFNTLTRTKEKFVPINENKINMYVCGPTVYNYIHIGNTRPLVVFDTFRRYMLSKGYDVTYVVNFTDVDDKIINQAKLENIKISEVTEKYIKAFEEDVKRLNLLESKTVHPRATEYINEMVEFIDGLIKKDKAYNVDGNVYFDVSTAIDYGKLSKKNIDELRSGARISIEEEKKNPLDFALWKKQKDEFEPAWESPWGMGRPGWHIECSVMSKSLLGDTLDIHAGGSDLQFPHHENEIAQSEGLNDKPFANYWMHNEMITIDNEKMSKSKNNFFLAKDIATMFDMEIVRFWILSVHYRNPINYSLEILNQTKSALERLYNSKNKLIELEKTAIDKEISKDEAIDIERIKETKKSFNIHMEDDLNTSDAISDMFEMAKIINTKVDSNSSKIIIETAFETLMSMANILGILYKTSDIINDEEILSLIEERNIARKNKDFKKSDEIRDLLKEKGIEIKDTKDGVKYHRI